MLKTKIKVNSVTHLTDARYFAAWEVEWLGFNLQPGHEKFIEPAQVLAIREWVDGPRITGEFDWAEADTIRQIAEDLQLDSLQVGPLLDLETVRALSDDYAVLREIVIEGYSEADDIEETLERFQPHVEAFVLNFSKGGIRWSDLEQGRPLSVATLADWCQRFTILLDIDLEQVSPSDLVEEIDLHGFAVSGGEEEQVGVKSFDELDAFFEDLETFED